MRVLFVCSQNRFRSPTAESVFAAYEGIEAASAGLDNDAVTPLTGELIEWAEIVFVMEKTHLNRLNKKFRHLLSGKRVVVLAIPDEFEYMEPALIDILRRRVTRHLNLRR